MSDKTDRVDVFTLSLLTAAVGASTMGTAAAAPTGFTPVSFTTNSASSQLFDVDGNGVSDFSISSNGTNAVALNALSTSQTMAGFAGSLSAFSSTSGFVPATGLKTNSAGGLIENFTSPQIFGTNQFSNFAAGVPAYAEVGLNTTYDGSGNVATATIGYFLATRTVVGSGAGEVDTITISDYGLVSNVPEPGSLALLAAGAAGIAALRRRWGMTTA